VARIFSTLAIVSITLLLANLAIGLALGDFGASSAEFDAAKRAYEALEVASDATSDQVAAARRLLTDTGERMVEQRQPFWIHIWLGVIAVMVSLLVNSVSITYFIGTSRWCSEVVHAFKLEPELADQSRRLKRRSFPWALLGILVTLGIASLGAAGDPFSSTSSPSTWVNAHWMLAIGGTVLIGASFVSQATALSANYQVISTIMQGVEERRASQRANNESSPEVAEEKAD
jgi:hypothetical protein